MPEFDEDDGLFDTSPGLPIPYLERLLLQNKVFGDQITFVGVGGEHNRCRIITRQPHVEGQEASVDVIEEGMGFLGFERLPERFCVGYAESMTFIRDDVVVFDLRPANVALTASGIMVPIDCIPIQVDAQTRDYLEGFL